MRSLTRVLLVTAISAIAVNIVPNIVAPEHNVCSAASVRTYGILKQNDEQKNTDDAYEDNICENINNICENVSEISEAISETSAAEEEYDPNRLYINGVDIEVQKGEKMNFTDENGVEDAKGKYYNGKKVWQECYGFAEWCQYKLYGNISLDGVDWTYRENSPNEFYRLTIDGILDSTKGAPTLTEENLKIIIQQAGAGSHLRTGGDHSIFITDVTDDGFTIAQCNGIYNDEYEGYINNYVGTHTFTWEEYINSEYAEKGIHFIELHY